MITLSDLLAMILPLVGIAIGIGIGAGFGVTGEIAGGAAGGVLGYYLGQLPTRIMIRNMRRKLAAFTPAELRAQLHDPKGCWTPNFLLMELRARGEDILPELPLVLGMMESEHRHRRIFGYAALLSAFPGAAGLCKGYNPSLPAEHCREKVGQLRGAIAQISPTQESPS